ncbi:hypothetical protein GOBAR_AA39019 [Gossypium barbadense]|uniref:Uncharacterized protein n=1 Tax=Gossypium barbadense TaxID=3634 RepID=A0A2P5VS68_GOSBA|nr:hypothetical protein GOBAR_AA39019 [Gossypium barbadense]
MGIEIDSTTVHEEIGPPRQMRLNSLRHFNSLRMMLSKFEAKKKNSEAFGNRKLLNKIKAISKDLYLDKNLPRTSFSALDTWSKPAGKTYYLELKTKLKNSNEVPSRKDNKSIWNWKPLNTFSNVRIRRLA